MVAGSTQPSPGDVDPGAEMACQGYESASRTGPSPCPAPAP